MSALVGRVGVVGVPGVPMRDPLWESFGPGDPVKKDPLREGGTLATFGASVPVSASVS